MQVYLFLSGEHPALPLAEARAVFAAERIGAKFRMLHRRLALADVRASRPRVEKALSRLALTHDAGRLLLSGPYDSRRLRARWPDVIPQNASVAARAERLDDATPWRRTEAEAEVGGLARRPADLRNPAVTLRVFLMAKKVLIGWRWFDRDPRDLAARKAQKRPFFSPVALEPKWARVLVNLASVRAGEVVADPFCGTGGILLEAASMGMRVVGSDLDPRMVEGARRNLAYFGRSPAALGPSDVAEAPGLYRNHRIRRVDAIVTDLPYGRSASTGKEDRSRLYRRAAEVWPRLLKRGGRLVVGVPNRRDVPVVGRRLRLEQVHEVRVHGGLTRRFAVFVR